jgi:hypothetical protein
MTQTIDSQFHRRKFEDETSTLLAISTIFDPDAALVQLHMFDNEGKSESGTL